MAQYQRAPYSTADPQQIMEDESDQEEEALVNDYKEQVQFDDGMSDLAQVTSGGGGVQDMQAQLAAAATPLEYQATLETKFASYDNYCSLFHYILNSDGPVDLEVPSVSSPPLPIQRTVNAKPGKSTSGPGMLSMSSSTNSSPSAGTATASPERALPTTKLKSFVTTRTLGAAIPSSTFSTPSSSAPKSTNNSQL